MATEKILEEDIVLNYFENGLGYKRIDSSLFKSEFLMVPTAFEEYFINNYPEAYDSLLKYEYSGNRKAMLQDLCKEVYEYIQSKFNVAIAMKNNKTNFKFKNFEIDLFRPYEYAKDDKNLYGVMNQFAVHFQGITKKHSLKPDVGVFINGILFSHIELKMPHRNQNAREQGSGKLIQNYITNVKNCVTDYIIADKNITEDTKKSLRVSGLGMFESMVHLISLDTNEAHVMRNIASFYKKAEDLYLKKNTTYEDLREEMMTYFYLDALYENSKKMGSMEKTKLFLKNTFAKERIQEEVVYLNLIGYERQSKISNGKKEVTNKTNIPFLITPRPNQKYALNKVLEDVVIKYQNEKNPDFELDKLRHRLEQDNIPASQIEEELEVRRLYTNNRNQYSLLLQYSAGFGKTYIICWLAAMLKDLHSSDGGKDYMFDKILLISDRVDLRDQTNLAMYNMSIDKSLFIEAETKEQLKKALTDKGTRLIIVNIQKFPHINEILNPRELDLLKNKRTAFLIDEIHRSNTGEQNKTMTNIFDEITNSATGSPDKKNLVIGLTATPSDEILGRYGEYQACTDKIKWKPFDCYTMRQAIEDRFVLDPTQMFITYATQFEYEEDDNKVAPSKQMLYEYKPRIQMNAKAIANILLSKTYQAIGGYAKAMLACYSISAAKKYYEELVKNIKEMTETNPQFTRFKNSRVYMVYSPKQDEQAAYTICSDDEVTYSSEKEVISAFKADKNGIMIVVDKLQTGFDEPRLHTLFLDKEVKDINAVQTLCRVNRTHKGKKDCMVVDFSLDNVNKQNVKNAFSKYEDMVCSSLDGKEGHGQIGYLYGRILISDIYDKFFKRFKNKNETTEAVLATDMNDYFVTNLSNPSMRTHIKSKLDEMLEYISKVNLLQNIIQLDKKFTDPTLFKFFKECMNLARNVSAGTVSEENKVIADFDIIANGEIILGDTLNQIEEKTDNKPKFKFDSDGFSSSLRLEDLNIQEDLKQVFIQDYKKNMIALFQAIMRKDKENIMNPGLLKMKVNNLEDYSNDNISEIFLKVFKAVKRRDKNDFYTTIEPIISYVEQDFYTYVAKNGWID